jgi:hypothetical protein
MMDSLLKAPATVMELAYLGITEIEIRQEASLICIHFINLQLYCAVIVKDYVPVYQKNTGISLF